MNRIYALVTMMLFAFTVNAQYIYNDFDANQNEPFNGWPNVPAIVANPDASGINTSANVGEWVRSTEQWAHVYCELDGKIDFSTGNSFFLKVHAPIACQVLFKLEDKSSGGGVFVEVSQSIVTPNTWEQLTFDFTGAASGTYDKIVIFFDFSSTVDNTFYFDDVIGPEYGAGSVKPYLALDVQDNFEDDGWGTITTWKFQDPDMVDLPVVVDPVNSANHVAEYNRSGTFEWTNAQFILEHRMDLTARNQFDLSVYFPSSNDYTGSLTPTAALKLQNSLMGPNAWMTQTQVLLDVTEFDQWVTLTFDFSGVADSVNYDQVVVQFGGEGHWAPGMFYFDDIELLHPVGIADRNLVNISVYPNPASDRLFIENAENLKSVSIYNINGRTMLSSDQVVRSIDLTDFSAGLYMFRAVGVDGKQYQAKFIVK